MGRSRTYAWGVTVASVIAALLLGAWLSTKRSHEAERWRTRALAAERQLTLLRDQLESVSAQLQSLSRGRAAISPTAVVPASAPEQPLPSSPSALPRPPLDPTPLDPARQDAWNALVTGALQSEVQRQLGRTLPPEQEQRLVETLVRLRDASSGLTEDPFDPEDSLSLRNRLTRTIILLEADRTFRDALGIGVSDFLRGLDAGQIEEVASGEPIADTAP
jgi:hypothetical protein